MIDHAQQLRTMADWFEGNNELLRPFIEEGVVGVAIDNGSISFYLYGAAEREKEVLRTLRRGIGGRFDKDDSLTDHLMLVADIGEDCKVRLIASREKVCRAVVVGQETVETIDYASAPKVTVTRDKIEWVCEPIGETVPA